VEQIERGSENSVKHYRRDGDCDGNCSARERDGAKPTADAQCSKYTREGTQQNCSFAAIQKQRDEDESIVEGNVRVDSGNADRDARSDEKCSSQ